jgi:site-specific recombinase XerD
MSDLKLAPEEVTMIQLQVNSNARASQRFKRLSAIAWRDAAIVALLLQGLKSREITELRLADLKHSKLIIEPRLGSRRTVELEDTTRLYLDKYLEDVIPEERVALFLNQRGKTLNVRTIERMISKLGDQLEINLFPSLLTNSASVE